MRGSLHCDVGRKSRLPLRRRGTVAVSSSARKHHCPRMKVSVAGAASGIMGVAAGGGSAIGLGGPRDEESLLYGPFGTKFEDLSLIH